jgi:hypothetical protein
MDGFMTIVDALSILTQFFRFTAHSFRDILRECLRDSRIAWQATWLDDI